MLNSEEHLQRQKSKRFTVYARFGWWLAMTLSGRVSIVSTVFWSRHKFTIAAVTFCLALLLLSPGARADEVISLTAATPCPSTNGNGGDWCQSNGGPAFNLSSFTTQNISLTGSSAFFEITNNTGHEVTTLALDFAGTLLNGPASCGGGSTGIQGSGPGNGSTTCTISPISGGFAIT